MRRITGLLVVLLLVPAPARGQQEDFGVGCARLIDLLGLVAARDGGEAARQLAGPGLPAALDRALGAAQDTPSANDLRGFPDQLELQVELLPRLFDEAAGLRESRVRMARDAGDRLEGSLSDLLKASRRLQVRASGLKGEAEGRTIASRLAARERPAGEELLVLAAQAPLLRALLTEPRSPAQVYQRLAELLDHPVDPLVVFALSLLERIPPLAPRELAAVDPAGAALGAGARAKRELTEARDALREAVDHSALALTALRDEELARVVAGGRSPELQQAVRLQAAFKAEFGVPPDLEATPWLDVYAQRGSGRLHFWHERPGTWLAGSVRVDPLEPVVAALLAARAPILRAQAGNARALGILYGAFPTPFHDVLTAFLGDVRLVADQTARASSLLDELGLPPLRSSLTALSEGAASGWTRLGVSPFQGSEAEALASEALLTAILEGGSSVGQTLVDSMARTRERWSAQRLVSVEVTLGNLPTGVRADLAWTPDPDDDCWLRPPPVRAQGRAVGVLLVPATAAPTVRLEAAARAGKGYVGGGIDVEPGTPAQLDLSAARGPRLVMTGDLVEQLPREGRLLHVWLETRDSKRLLRPAPRGAWLEPAPGEVGRGRLVGRDGQGAARTEGLTVDLPRSPWVVIEGDPWGVEPESELVVRVLGPEGRPLGGPHWFEVREQSGALLHRVEVDVLRWTVQLPVGRYSIGVEGAQPAPLAVAVRPAQITAVMDPLGGAVSSVAPGQGVILRLDAWPWLLAEDVTRVDWTVAGGSGPPRQAVGYPLPHDRGAALFLPVVVSQRAAAGPRQIEATVHTTRGTRTIAGTFSVADTSEEVQLELLNAAGRIKSSLPRGGEALVRAPVELSAASWTLVDPAGRVRRLEPRFDGLVPWRVEPEGLWGKYQVWLSGTAATGQAVHGRLSVSVTKGEEAPTSGLRLVRVDVKVLGSEWRSEQLVSVSARDSGRAPGLLRAPGPFGELAARVELPSSWEAPRARVFLVAEPSQPPRDAVLPGIWAEQRERAQPCLEARFTLKVDGREVELATERRVEAGGVDLGLSLEATDAGSLTLVRYDRPEARVLPSEATAGANEVELRIVARLLPALPPALWPRAQGRPDPLEIDGVRWAVDPGQLPPTEIELRARWVREGAVAATELGDLRAGSAGLHLDLELEAKAAQDALEANTPAAAAVHARRAVLASQEDPRPWVSLGQSALRRGRAAEASALARHALDTRPTAAAWLLLADSALNEFRLEEARAALEAAQELVERGSEDEERVRALRRRLD